MLGSSWDVQRLGHSASTAIALDSNPGQGSTPQAIWYGQKPKEFLMWQDDCITL